ncbi:MAG TPA: hypothetical protein VLH15_10590 [Dehalococcoidales bacterium]|nr:hypothetical protein [Dehalococcoidales bacterium]
MNTLKYADRIITGTGYQATHVMKVDPNRLKDFFAVDSTWFWSSEPNQIVDGTRISEANQVIGLVGAFPAEPTSLGGEMTIWVDGKKNVLNKSSLIYVPAGVPFGPVQINHMEHPINYTSIGILPAPNAKRDPSWPRYTIVSETKEKAVNPPMPVKLTLKGFRLLHMEDDIAKGSFYVDYVWLYEGYGGAPMGVHDHQWSELIAMTGCDPANPYDLGGTFSVDLAGETHYVTKSALVCIPAHVMHCPWKFLDVKKPTLAFTASPSGMYYSSEKDKW